jgi:hypothetical protein
MRVSRAAEYYAQRAVDKRRELEDKERLEKKLGDYALVSYLAEGMHLETALKSLPRDERIGYILKNSELITSSDGAEGIHIVWGPNRAVLTHRLLSLTMRRELGNKHYLKSWWRDTITTSRDSLRESCRHMLNVRVENRIERAKQGALPLDLSKEEIEAEPPQFLVDGDAATWLN